MPYIIFFFDEGFSDEDFFDPRSVSNHYDSNDYGPDDYDSNDYGPDDYDFDSPCNGCMKESCIGCDIIEYEAYHERLANIDWDCISGIYYE